MLAEQVGGHTPTLEGFHWRHDALLHQDSGMTVGCFCMKCQSVSKCKAKDIADSCSPHILNKSLHNLSIAFTLKPLTVCDKPEFLLCPPHVSFGTVDSLLSISE